MTAPEVFATDRPAGPSRFSNNWPVLPLRAFLAVLFLFAGYAKFSYPGFFDPQSLTGLKATVDSAISPDETMKARRQPTRLARSGIR